MNEESLYQYKARIDRVIDGDTVNLTLSLGCDVYIKERCRLYGINCPETYGVKKNSNEYKRGKEATEFVRKMVEGKEVMVRTHRDKRGKFGRYLIDLYPLKSKTSINDELVKKGLAIPYFGGKRK